MNNFALLCIYTLHIARTDMCVCMFGALKMTDMKMEDKFRQIRKSSLIWNWRK